MDSRERKEARDLIWIRPRYTLNNFFNKDVSNTRTAYTCTKLRVKIFKEYLRTIFLMISCESALVNGYAMNKKISCHKYFQYFDVLPSPSSLHILELLA